MKIWISLFAVLCFAHIAHAQAPVENPDVPMDNPAYNDLRRLVQYDLVANPHEGMYTFFPFMTRYEFAVSVAAMLSNLYDQNDPQPDPYSLRQNYRLKKSYREVFEKHPEVAASFVRLLKEFAPEFIALGFTPMQLKVAQIELSAGRVNTLRGGRESTPILKPPIAAPFPDVPKTHWAFGAVERLRQSGIVIGNSTGAFAK